MYTAESSESESHEYSALEHHNRSIRRLIDVVQQLSLARNLESIIDIVRHAARELTGADGATFVLRDRDECYYVDEDAIGPLWKGQRFPMSACVSGWTMLHRKPAAIENIYADSRIPADAYRPTFVKSLVMIPIRVQQPIGAIGSYWANRHCATTEEIDLLQALANTTSVAIENVELYRDLESRVQQRTLQLEAANRELESFSYSISHDLRAPLRHMDGFSVCLEEELGQNLTPEASKHLAKIRSATSRMRGLIEDLLRLSRLGSAKLDFQLVDLSALARGIVETQQQAQTGRQVTIKVVDNLTVYGDPGLLQIALENLLSNAWKYTEKTESPFIEFGAKEASSDTNVFYVRDNGAGFDMKYANKLFAPFQRLHNEVEFRGSGVGLATVQRIIHRHNGRIWPRAEVNKGATFFFSLPVAFNES